MPLLGVNTDLADDVAVARLPTTTDTAFLLTADANGPATPTVFTAAEQVAAQFADATTMLAETDTLFGNGAVNVVAVRIVAGVTGVADTLALLPADTLGPGQVVAPSVVTASDVGVLAAHALAAKRVVIANAPAGATDAALGTLADAVKAAGDSRFAGLWADTLTVPGPGGVTRTVPFSLAVAGMIARNDTRPGGGNPNQAAAGAGGVVTYGLGVADERTDARRDTLTPKQVNTAKTVAGQLRNYGSRTLADLVNRPQWKDLGGARVVMDLAAHIRSADENELFGQIDGKGTAQDALHGVAAGRCLSLLELGALYAGVDARGRPIAPFVVETGPALNPISQVAQGRLKVRAGLRTSPTLERIDQTLVKQRLDA